MAGTNGKEKLPQEVRSLGTESLPSATAGFWGSKPARSDVEGGDRRKQEIERRRKEEEKRRAEMERKRKGEMEKEKYERELLEKQKRRKSLSTIASEEGEGNEGEDEGESEIEKVRRSPSDVEKREIERIARERRRIKEVEEGLTQTESETAESDKEFSRKRKKERVWTARLKEVKVKIIWWKLKKLLRHGLEKLLTIERWFRTTRTKTKGISIAVETKLFGYLRVIKNSVEKEKMERERINGRIEGREEVMKMIREVSLERRIEKIDEGSMVEETDVEMEGRRKTYAGKLKEGLKIPKMSGVKKVVNEARIVLIRKDGAESEAVKEDVKKAVDPRKLGLRVKRVGKVRNGIMVEVESEKGKEMLMINEDLKSKGLKVEEP
ncbi:vicilin-like seed storage protein At2g18540 [Homalodisca vitripennis]|uniref:vicilin-like seed storage protein At2g18540 n=1 Tax=Homalodisca vitripennis TaxID=197043 RepID=UPI001EEA9638|nr:vicilin-like seed storage protein At2g18540 [Homalodisca vitripennis]